MSRLDLTDAQIQALLFALRQTLQPWHLRQVEQLVTELQALRERESVTRALYEIEGAV